MRLRILSALTACAIVLAVAAAAQASVIIDSADPRDVTGVNQPGLTYKETGAAIDNFGAIAWYVDRRVGESQIRGYSQDINQLDLKNTIDGSVSDPAGELGIDITGIGYLPNQEMLAIADNSNDRVVIYDRINIGGSDPAVDYSTGRSLAVSGNGTLFNAPNGLAVNEESGTIYVSVDTGPNGRGIVAFNAVTENEVAQATGYATGDPSALAVNRVTGTVFAAIDGTGTIQALRPSLSESAVGFPHPIMTSGTPGDYISLSADPENNRLWALKANQLDIFSMTTGTFLGTANGYDFAGQATSISASTPYYGISYSGQSMPQWFYSFFETPRPVCNPQAPPTVVAGASVTFTPDCNDEDLSPVREYSVTNSPTRGSAAVTPDYTKFTYTASATASSGQDSVAFRVVTQNGMSAVKHQLVNVVAAPAPPSEKPVVRETTNLQLESGDVYIKVPGSNEFVKLTKDTLIPIGTVIDAREGKAHLTFANADGTLYDGTFWDGIFQVIQGSGDKPIATMKLRDDLVAKASGFATASTVAELERSFYAYTARKRGKKKNGLWGNAKGKYRTSGKGGTATVRGTRWYVANYTYGSLFKVSRGSVTIDPIRGKNFTLKAGKSFFIFYKR